MIMGIGIFKKESLAMRTYFCINLTEIAVMH